MQRPSLKSCKSGFHVGSERATSLTARAQLDRGFGGDPRLGEDRRGDVLYGAGCYAWSLDAHAGDREPRLDREVERRGLP